MAQYPHIVLEVSTDPVLTDIVAGRYDAGIRLGHRVARDMIAVRVTDDLRVVVVASPDYLARHPRPVKPQDLHAHNCIRLRFPSGAFLPWRFAIEGKVVEIEVEGSLVANASLLVQAALGGAGVLYDLEEFAAPIIATGQLVPLLEAWIPPPSEGFFLYYPSRRQNLASLRALVDFLRANLKAKTASAARKQRIISATKSTARPSGRHRKTG
jgi:DNA-binding transcriptional LysR family regulator